MRVLNLHNLGLKRQLVHGHRSLGQTCASHQTPTLNSQKLLTEINGSQMPNSSRMRKLGGGTGFKGEGVGTVPKSSIICARSVCRESCRFLSPVGKVLTFPSLPEIQGKKQSLTYPRRR